MILFAVAYKALSEKGSTLGNNLLSANNSFYL